MPEEKLYTTQQAADRLSVTPGRVRQLAGPMGVGTKVGRDWVFTEDDIARLRQREDRRKKPTPPTEPTDQ